MQKKQVNVVWFKRDLRLSDHEPLARALKEELPVILLFVFEPSLMKSSVSDTRHWRFVYESLEDMQSRVGQCIHVLKAECIVVFEFLIQQYDIKTIFSYQETGIQLTYDRDLLLIDFFKNRGISWVEFQTNGVQRGRHNREGWSKSWYKAMSGPLTNPSIDVSRIIYDEKFQNRFEFERIGILQLGDHVMQKGGEKLARQYMSTFSLEGVISTISIFLSLQRVGEVVAD